MRLSVAVGARRRPRRAREGAGVGRSSSWSASRLRSRPARRSSSSWCRRVAAGNARRGGDEGEEPTGQGGHGARGRRAQSIHGVPRRRRGSAREPATTRSWWENAADRHPPCGDSHRAGGRGGVTGRRRRAAGRPATGRPGPGPGPTGASGVDRRTGGTMPRQIGPQAGGRAASRRRRGGSGDPPASGGTVDDDERAVAGRASGPPSWHSGCRPDRSSCCPSATEQHGPHLPYSTDTVIAEAVARATVQEVGEELDAWPLPVLASRSPTSTPGRRGRSGCRPRPAGRARRPRTLRGATPARTLVFMNGHGGNSSLLNVACRELRLAHGLRTFLAHPGCRRTRAGRARPRSSAWASTAAWTRRR
jgi:hypothetical protein